LSGWIANLRGICEEFGPMFKCTTRDNTETAFRYLCGLLQSERRNMERMEEVVEEADYQALQQFITDSPWDARAVMRGVAAGINGTLGGTASSALLIDESSFAKKGKHSVGVARQWNGRLGKRDNCQTGVFAALCAGDQAALVNARLYLPEEWVEDPARCRAAGVPEEAIRFRTKCQLALEMVRELRAWGVAFRYVRADAFYGNSWEFCRGLADEGEVFLVDLPVDRLIYLDDPAPRLTPAGRTGRAGRPGSRPHYHPQGEALSLRDYVATLTPADWTTCDIRPGTKGNVRADIHYRRVWFWEQDRERADCWHLLIRRDLADGRIACMASNAPAETPWAELVRGGAQRHWIERDFQDAKSQVGLAHYQVRGWRAWHHHVAMCLLAMYFIFRQKLLYQGPSLPLTAGEIRYLLVAFLTYPETRLPHFWDRFVSRQKDRRASSDAAMEEQREMTKRKGIHVVDLTK
jgi:SRSO17 transposase